MSWWLVGGIGAANCNIAYQAIGALNLASSYGNLNNPGTNNASGIAPAFSPLDGWTFNGTTQYLTTGLAAAFGDSIFMRVSNVVLAYAYLMGGYDSGWYNVGFVTDIDSNMKGVYGENLYIIAANASAVLGITPNKMYYNGLPIAFTSRDWNGHLATPRPLFIGANDNAGTPSNFASVKVQAYTHYNITVTDAQALAISNSMAALPPVLRGAVKISDIRQQASAIGDSRIHRVPVGDALHTNAQIGAGKFHSVSTFDHRGGVS